ncbi:hypothetical protein Dda_3172 [Drechslerella dactyloides]|uniref:Uncharacterized protein n=1 Tax=Drechslerella dactyloides TaxID=74499 RepID=A0AAD6J0U9_DREDA|nr:hypothetical protein Dda_3172 [Drechslerella dactyloides]
MLARAVFTRSALQSPLRGLLFSHQQRNLSSGQKAEVKRDFQATGKNAVDMAQFLTGRIHRPGLLLDTNLLQAIFEGDKVSDWFDQVQRYSLKLATTRVSVREYAASPIIMDKYEYNEVLALFEQHKIEIKGYRTAEKVAEAQKNSKGGGKNIRSNKYSNL